MRHFSQNEQRSIQLLVNNSKQNNTFVLANVYQDVFYQQKVEYSNSELIFYRDINSIRTEDILSIESFVLEISLLIDYLEKQRYIYIIEEGNVSNLTTIGGFDKTGLTAVRKHISPEVSSCIERSLNHRVFVGQDLKELVQNKFELIEDKMLSAAEDTLCQTKKQSRWAFITMIIALVTMIIAIVSK